MSTEHRDVVDEQLISREEEVALLFNVSDMATSLARIDVLLEGSDAGRR
jgi:hypothetical protein